MITSRNAAEAAVNKILKLLDIKKKNGAEPEPQTSPADTATVDA